MSETWEPGVRTRGFYVSFAISALLVLVLFSPFLDALVYATVVSAVAWPVHCRIRERLGGREYTAALLTTLSFLVVIVLPVSLIVYRISLEGLAFGRLGLDWIAEGNLERWVEGMREVWAGPRFDFVRQFLPEDSDPVAVVSGPLRELMTGAFSASSSALPNLLSGAFRGTISVVLFLFAVVSLLAEWPRVRAYFGDVLPLERRFQNRLIHVFREFAVNMVLGAFVVAAAQGVVATIGYALLGVPRPLLFGALTAVASFVPIFGTMLIAVPLSAWMVSLYGWGWGLGLLLYGVGVVGVVDNIVRPIVMRGNTKIHPLLIFLAVFGGMWWLGLAGVLIGPVVVASFLAMSTILREGLVDPP